MADFISPEEFRDKIDRDESFHLIDTRSESDYDEWHINEAINIPYSEENGSLDEFISSENFDPGDQIITVCAKGVTSAALAEKLESKGFSDVKTIKGGLRAWSGLYDRVPISTEDDDLVIVQLQRRAKGCLGYIVGSKESREAASVDVSRYTKEFIDAATDLGLQITHVLDTHVHADHISGGRELATKLGVDYFLGSGVNERKPDFDYVPVKSNQVLEVGGHHIKAIHTPGHTTEMTSWLVDGEALISGDSLFVDSIGRTELEFEEDAERGAVLQYRSLLEKVLSLPDKTKILPGHFSVSDSGESGGVTPGTPIFSTIGYLRKNNKALQMEKEEFVDYMFQNVPTKPPNYEEVIGINLGRQERGSEEQEIELELGPNRCAASEESMVDSS
jgi:glyoxylase-like metal-dependent hydrolase (beta-lactamase superfamily II)/rhodanese-related sulfurtransferase